MAKADPELPRFLSHTVNGLGVGLFFFRFGHFGYRFRPWRGEKAIADGPSILDYLNDTAREYGIDRKIRYPLSTTRFFVQPVSCAELPFSVHLMAAMLSAQARAKGRLHALSMGDEASLIARARREPFNGVASKTRSQMRMAASLTKAR